jgi:outer membrane lipoprotein-sorting protein
VDGQPFAHALTLDVAAGDTRAEISLRDVELNPELPPDIFRLRQPAAGDGGAGPGA